MRISDGWLESIPDVNSLIVELCVSAPSPDRAIHYSVRYLGLLQLTPSLDTSLIFPKLGNPGRWTSFPCSGPIYSTTTTNVPGT